MSLAALFLRFLKFGMLAFGGPVAQIALLRRELVEEERWISSARFNRLLAVMQILPGPEAHELCVHLGMRARGRLGGLLAGLGFMLPGFVLMLALSWLYFQLDFDRSWLGAALLGVQAGVAALIVRAVHRIGEHVLVDGWLWAIAAGSAGAALAGISFWLALSVGGAVYALKRSGRRAIAVCLALAGATLGAGLALTMEPGAPSAFVEGAGKQPGDVAAWILFLAGFKTGLLTFGGAYTAIPFLRADSMRQGWMGDAQFLDGLALSGVLPAPLIIFSTFVGYVAGGPWGAVAITAGIFLPAFAFSLIFYDRLEAVLENVRLHALLEGVAAAVVGLIAVTAAQLAWGLLSDADQRLAVAAILLAALGAVYLWKSKLASPLILLAAGVAGVLAF
ncbi:chromate efflux transporter [Brevundimonas faecalis]|uniref:Chromate transporter n=1 Tax=Brevundimonas faecalis TaxID=947378 RepID=A0ABV2R7Y2_9CAUL